MTAEVRLVDADELRRRIEANRSAWDAWSYRNALYLLDSLSTVTAPKGWTRDEVLAELAKHPDNVCEWLISLTEADLAEMLPDALDRQVASAFAALRDALARDAQVREIVQSMRTATVQGDVWAVVGRLAALYPESEVASMLRDGEGVDDSDIVPGSEFDGPVVL